MANPHNSILYNATIGEINGANFQTGPSAADVREDAARDRLEKHIAPNALPNSDAMYDGPKCYPETRKAIHRKLGMWIRQRDDLDTKFIWLQGGAGAGKSAIMRTIAMGGPIKRNSSKSIPYSGQKSDSDSTSDWGVDSDSDSDSNSNYSDIPHVLGSFFFSRQDPTRNTARSLVPTLALQLCDAHSAARGIILKTIAEKRELIFTTSILNQVRALLIRPLAHLEREYRWLSQAHKVPDERQPRRVFVIDGLDECIEPNKQREVIEALAGLVKELPVRVLLASRPDEPIPSAISHSPLLRGIHSEIALSDDPDSNHDIHLFLKESLGEVRERWKSRPFGSLPHPWPTKYEINALVWKSSGHFIFASTAAKYVASGVERPDIALRVILGLHPPRLGQPFEELDALYRHILSKARFPREVMDILSFLLLASPKRRDDIELIHYFLGYPPSDVVLFLSDMQALVTIQVDHNMYHQVRLRHKSFEDFLRIQTRAQEFFIGTQRQFHRSHLQSYFALLKEYIGTSHASDLSSLLVKNVTTGIATSTLSDTATALVRQHPPRLIYNFLTLDSPNSFIHRDEYASYMRAIRLYAPENSTVYEDSLNDFLHHLQEIVSPFASDNNPVSIVIPLLRVGFDIDALHTIYKGHVDLQDEEKLQPIFDVFHSEGGTIPLCKRHRWPFPILRQTGTEADNVEDNLEAAVLKILQMIMRYPGWLEQTQAEAMPWMFPEVLISLLEAVTFALPKVAYCEAIAFHAMFELPAPSYFVGEGWNDDSQKLDRAMKRARRAIEAYLCHGRHMVIDTEIGHSGLRDGAEGDDGDSGKDPDQLATFTYDPKCGVCKKLQGLEVE